MLLYLSFFFMNFVYENLFQMLMELQDWKEALAYCRSTIPVYQSKLSFTLIPQWEIIEVLLLLCLAASLFCMLNNPWGIKKTGITTKKRKMRHQQRLQNNWSFCYLNRVHYRGIKASSCCGLKFHSWDVIWLVIDVDMCGLMNERSGVYF